MQVNPNLDVLPVNSFVKLPPWDASVCPDPSTAASCRVYVAESGDSLSLIATAFSVNLADLQTANTALNADAMTVLQPGQRVKLPPFPDNCGDGERARLALIGAAGLCIFCTQPCWHVPARCWQ